MKNTFCSFLFIGVFTISHGYCQQLIFQNNEIKEKSFQSLTAFAALNEPILNRVTLNYQETVSPKLRNAGIICTGLGVATIIVGAFMVNAADGVTYYHSQTYNGYTQSEGSLSGALGALGIIGGSVSTIGGGIMWYLGHRKLQKQKKGTAFYFTPNSSSLVYRF